MPNIEQLRNLKARYPSFVPDLKDSDFDILNEAFDTRILGKEWTDIVKSFSFDEKEVKKYITFFKERRKVETIVLFIDITSFSTRFEVTRSDDLVEYLDRYYDIVIPIIGEHGGVVEKIIGDGIICVFGKPFLQEDRVALHRKAEKCSMKIIAETMDTVYESKVALHYGEVMYYQNQSVDYQEFTMIGSTLTELFRLESISKTNAINFYSSTLYENLNLSDIKNNEKFPNNGTPPNYHWLLSDQLDINLKGVREYRKFRTLTLAPKP